MGFKLVLTLGRCRFFHFTTAGAQLQLLAVCFAGGFANLYTLPYMTQRIYIIALFDLSTGCA